LPDRRYRILAIASHPVQYMAPLLRRMAHHQQLDLSVAYCTLRGVQPAHDPEFNTTVQWDVPLLDGYPWQEVPNRGLRGDSPRSLFNPGLSSLVGEDAPESYTSLIELLDLQHKVEFSEPSEDVLRFYAAADLYAGPSMEDSFCLPIAEAMACGLPVIASVNAGASELIRHQDNGVLLHEPTDATELAALIRTIVTDGELRERLGRAAARTIEASCSWDRNADRTREFLQNVLGSDKNHS
jgi:hypothetical protein